MASICAYPDRDSWLIDFYVLYHMTTRREWLCEYEKYDGDNVLLADDSPIRIAMRCKVQLKLKYGRIGTLPSS